MGGKRKYRAGANKRYRTSRKVKKECTVNSNGM